MNFYKLAHYKNAVEFLVQILKSEDIVSNYTHQHLPEYNSDLLDKIFHVILIENKIPENYFEFLEITIKSLNSRWNFLIQLINFQKMVLSVNEDSELQEYFKVKQLFNYCFTDEICPKIMWLWCVRYFINLYNSNLFFTH